MIELNKRWNIGLAIAAIVVLAMPLLPLSGGLVENEEIVVHDGETFEIETTEALHPFYDWRLTDYDDEYLKFLGESYRPPEDDILGITIKVFEFKAIRSGITEVTFTYYELDVDGELIAEIDSGEYAKEITSCSWPKARRASARRVRSRLCSRRSPVLNFNAPSRLS